MNREISKLRVAGEVQRIVEDINSVSCRARAPHVVDLDVLGHFLVLAIGPPILVVVISLLCGHIVECLARRHIDSAERARRACN